MPLTLLESNRRTFTWRAAARDVYGMGIEAVVVAAVLVTAPGGQAHRDAPAEQSARFLAPLLQPQPRPIEERIHWIGVGGGAAQSQPSGVIRSEQALDGMVAGLDMQPLAGVGEPPAHVDDPNRPLSEIEVDSTVQLDSAARGPEYPGAMLAQSIEGSVYARFVVDTNGVVDMTTFTLRPSTDSGALTHDGFIEAVRDALPGLRYRPAMRAGRRVRQLVDQPFHFRIR